jgi:hypothetical protein
MLESDFKVRNGRRLGRAYMFDEGTLMLESVTLAKMVELVVQVFVDLAACTVFYEETA